MAGGVCPQSGWWACADEDGKLRVQFGERQHFTRGNVMPQAMLLGQHKREQPKFNTENPTIWTLVEMDRPAPHYSEQVAVAKRDIREG